MKHPARRPATDRIWARALVVRHARDHAVRLVDVVEIDGGGDVRAGLERLTHLTAPADVTLLLTHGLPPGLASRLARGLDLGHELVCALDVLAGTDLVDRKDASR